MEKSWRFRSVAAALRFYFRAEEILCVRASPNLHPEGRIPGTGRSRREDLMFDFLSIGACLKGFSELQLWLLRELYRPAGVKETSPSVTSVCKAGSSRFPRLRWTIQGVGRLKRHTLEAIEATLVVKGLIPRPARSPTSRPAHGATGKFTSIRLGDVYGEQSAQAKPEGRDFGVACLSAREATGVPRRAPRKRIEVVFGLARSKR